MQATKPNIKYFSNAGKVPENGRQVAGDTSQNFCQNLLHGRLA